MAAKRRKSPKRSRGKRDKRRRKAIPPLFLDESVASPKLAAALHGIGFRVHLLTDYFAKGTADDVWLRKVGRNGWLAVTRDRDIKQNEFELLAVQQGKVGLFVLRMKKGGVPVWANAIRKAQRRILTIVETTPVPFVVHVTASGQTSVTWSSISSGLTPGAV